MAIRVIRTAPVRGHDRPVEPGTVLDHLAATEERDLVAIGKAVYETLASPAVTVTQQTGEVSRGRRKRG